jgi:hypothetical protein
MPLQVEAAVAEPAQEPLSRLIAGQQARPDPLGDDEDR